jgi:TrmH family RNA methyltransferase
MSNFALQMLTAQRKKEIISLKQKKYRQRYKQFVVEGEKSVIELCRSTYKVSEILLTQTVFERIGEQLINQNLLIINKQDSEQISNLETSPGILAVSNFKETELKALTFNQKFTLVLDAISDPGNLGTIIRIADWYGIESVICSENCVDFYNPKTIAATMGSFSRVQVVYTDLIAFLKKTPLPSFACVMDGISLSETLKQKPKEGFIIIGNEANGIHESLLNLVSDKMTIPRFGQAESLNAAIATAIVCHSLIAT